MNKNVVWLSIDSQPLFLANNSEPYGMEVSFKTISQRQQTETDSDRTNNILRSIINDTNNVVFVKDLQGRYVFANQAAADCLNVAVEEIIGRDDTALFAPKIARSIREKDRQVINEGKKYSYEEEIFDRERRVLLTNKFPWRDETKNILGVIGISNDITQLKQTEQKLQENQQLLRLALSNANAGCWDWEIGTGKVTWSPENYDLYGIDPQIKPLKHRDWEQLVHPEDRNRVIRDEEKVILGQSANSRTEFRIIHPQKGVRWLLGVGDVILNENNRPIRLSGINLDITERKQLEAKLRQQTEELIQANQLKDDFLAIVSHELRTPLNPILGWSQLLEAGQLDSKQVERGLQIIKRNAKLQSRLIEDLLDVSRILRDKLSLKLTPINLEHVVNSTWETVKLAAEAKSIQIKTVFEPDVGQISGDTTRLQQIIWNLLSNAIKFTPEGGQITIKLNQIGTQAQIQVQDTGRGIEPEFLPYVFDRFQQEESSHTRKHDGLGLGLAIVRYLTELHRGTVSVESLGVGQGATFTVKLPLIEHS